MTRLPGLAGPLLAAIGVFSVGPALAGPAVSGFIVQVREDGASNDGSAALLGLLAERALTSVRALGGRWHAVRPGALLDSAAVQALEARLRADPRVRAVVPDVREQRQDVTCGDARFGAQWWLQAVAPGNTGVAGLAKAWERSTGVANGVVVAVLDSGITSHIETNARVLPGHDFVADAVYAGDGNGRDNDPSDPGDAISADDRLRHPAQFSGCPDVLRSSWHGSTVSRAGFKAAYAKTARRWRWPGLAVMAAAAGSVNQALPACATAALSPPAIWATRRPARRAMQQPLAAVFAAPAVAAAASLMLAVNPQLTALQIEQGLRLSARAHVAVPLLGSCAAGNAGPCACTTATRGAGLLDAEQALAFAAAPAGFQPLVRQPDTLADEHLRACATALRRPVEVIPPSPTPPPTMPPQAGGSGSGGGALQPGWLLGLAWAVWGPWLARRRAAAGGPYSGRCLSVMACWHDVWTRRPPAKGSTTGGCRARHRSIAWDS